MKDNKILKNYNKILNASKKASIAAHIATINHLRSQNIDIENIFVSSNVNEIKLREEQKSNKTKLEFELDEDLIKFYQESLKFKREKQEEEKKRFKGNLNEYVEGEQVKLTANMQTSSAPFERAGIQREEELKTLYGTDASRMQLIETNIQMNYDKKLDLYQPKYWPSFPLKIKFN